jgi:hypothetical protein
VPVCGPSTNALKLLDKERILPDFDSKIGKAILPEIQAQQGFCLFFVRGFGA